MEYVLTLIVAGEPCPPCGCSHFSFSTTKHFRCRRLHCDGTAAHVSVCKFIILLFRWLHRRSLACANPQLYSAQISCLAGRFCVVYYRPDQRIAMRSRFRTKRSFFWLFRFFPSFLSCADAYYSKDWTQTDFCYVQSQVNINMTWHPHAKPTGPYTCVEFANAVEKSTSVRRLACVLCVRALCDRV